LTLRDGRGQGIGAAPCAGQLDPARALRRLRRWGSGCRRRWKHSWGGWL